MMIEKPIDLYQMYVILPEELQRERRALVLLRGA
jgi:hypothetical protein